MKREKVCIISEWATRVGVLSRLSENTMSHTHALYPKVTLIPITP